MATKTKPKKKSSTKTRPKSRTRKSTTKNTGRTTKKGVADRTVLTTEKIEEIRKRDEQGIKIHRNEKYWYSNEKDVRKADLTFAMNREEIEEWTKCKMSVQYFAEKYCKIKREDGTIGNIKLRDYQKEIIDLYTQNRFSILMSSRQMGKCTDYNTIVTLKYPNGKIIKKTLGELYYELIKTYRKLTLPEKTKKLLYKILKLIG